MRSPCTVVEPGLPERPYRIHVHGCQELGLLSEQKPKSPLRLLERPSYGQLQVKISEEGSL